jgi:F-type H+-transporting ATPase subunit delta
VTSTQSARRYARALLETAADPAAVRDDLHALAASFKDHPSLADALAHPAVAAEQKKAIVTSVYANLASPLPKLLDLLIERGRMALVPEIAVQYRAAWNEANNVHPARVIAAQDLDADSVAAVKSALETAVKGTVEIRTATDPSLIGGLKVEIDGTIYDGSAKARLGALRKSLVGA